MINPRIVIIGSGNMGYHLSVSFNNAKVDLSQVFNRSKRGLKKIASDADVETTSALRSFDSSADIYIIAVSDDAIEPVAKKLSEHIPSSAIVVHTSGSQSMYCLQDSFKNIGVFYPLQSLKIERPVDFSNVPIFISSENAAVEERLSILASKISKNIIPIEDNKRSELHIPAVVVNNFVNHMYTMAHQYSVENEIEFKYFIPLMQETLDRLKDGTDPSKLQTGPAIRQDQKTIDKHLTKLKGNKDFRSLYQYMTKQIQQYYHENS